MSKGSDNEFPSLLIKEGTAPASPAAGDQRLFIDSADHALKVKNSAGTVSAVGGGGGGGSAVANSARAFITSGDYTITSTTFVDVDATNAKLVLTTGARGVLIGVIASGTCAGAQNLCLDLDIDGSRASGAVYGMMPPKASTAEVNLSFTFLTAALSAGSHTIKLQVRITYGTGTLFASTTVSPLHMWAIEQQS